MKLYATIAALSLSAALASGPAFGGQAADVIADPNMAKANLYLMAGDYRRALETCQRSINEMPSVKGYIRLTYVYQAIDGYLEQLSQDERWMAVEQLYLNLAYRDIEDLVDPPGGLERIAKEMIHTSVRQQSDSSAAMAVRLDNTAYDRPRQQQTQ